jgi:undecaprenyl diphosphate synthase
VNGLHVAVIMDGNGRWAQARGLPRSAGHVRGVEALRAVVEAAPPLGIGTLSAYAFSADNWKRPRAEIDVLFDLFRSYVSREACAMRDAGIRLSVIGRRDRVGAAFVDAIDVAEETTRGGRRLHLRLAIDYSARDAIALAAAGSGTEGPVTRDRLSARVGSGRGVLSATPDVDLLIRTGGEQRLSDFLLWECAYAELWFTRAMWPDFGASGLARAVDDFHARDRRYGGVAAS